MQLPFAGAYRSCRHDNARGTDLLPLEEGDLVDSGPPANDERSDDDHVIHQKRVSIRKKRASLHEGLKESGLLGEAMAPIDIEASDAEDDYEKQVSSVCQKRTSHLSAKRMLGENMSESCGQDESARHSEGTQQSLEEMRGTGLLVLEETEAYPIESRRIPKRLSLLQEKRASLHEGLKATGLLPAEDNE